MMNDQDWFTLSEYGTSSQYDDMDECPLDSTESFDFVLTSLEEPVKFISHVIENSQGTTIRRPTILTTSDQLTRIWDACFHYVEDSSYHSRDTITSNHSTVDISNHPMIINNPQRTNPANFHLALSRYGNRLFRIQDANIRSGHQIMTSERFGGCCSNNSAWNLSYITTNVSSGVEPLDHQDINDSPIINSTISSNFTPDEEIGNIVHDNNNLNLALDPPPFQKRVKKRGPSRLSSSYANFFISDTTGNEKKTRQSRHVSSISSCDESFSPRSSSNQQDDLTFESCCLRNASVVSPNNKSWS